MQYLKKLLNNVEEYIMVATLIAMSILNFANVVSRYFLHFSISFTEEVLMILFLWCSMFGIVAGFKRGLHLGFSMLTDRISGKTKIGIITLTTFITCALMAIIAYSATLMIQSEIVYNQTTPVLKIPEIYATISIPLGCFLSIIRILTRLWEEIKQERKGATV